jgi:hypothetical protein
MTSTMVRKFAVTTFAAAGALATFGAASAVAGRTISPFTGQYTGPLPDAYVAQDWGSIAISSDGKIVGTKPPAGFSDTRFTGTVRDDGTFEILGTWNPNKFRWWVTDVHPVLAAGTVTYVQSAGTIVLGTDGNLHGTTTYGNSFVWRRQ